MEGTTMSDMRRMMMMFTKPVDSGGGGDDPTPVSPYDARVDYISATGSQYINTGISFNGVENWQIELDFAPTRFYNYNAISCIGTGTVNESWIYNNGQYAFRYNNVKSSNIQLSLNTRTLLKIVYSKPNCVIFLDGTQKASISANPTTISDPMWLFHRANYAELKAYGFKLYQNNDIVLDMIPVRKNGAGYMYDTVSEELFGNAGTGTFAYGNDVTT